MKTKHTFLRSKRTSCLAVAIHWMAFMLPLMACGQNLRDYTASSEPGEWQSIASTGTLLASVTGDYGNQTLALPFDFMFGQSEYPAGTNITVRADGFVRLRTNSGSGLSHNAIAYWDDQSTSIISPFMLFDGQMPEGASGCWWQVMTDDNGNQMLVIEWQHVQHYPMHPLSSAEAAQDNFNFQLRLHANGDISAVYGAMHNGVTNDTLFNFMLVDGATTWQHEYFPGYSQTEVDHVALRGTWDSVLVSVTRPAYRSGNNWVISPDNNPVGLPDSGTVVTWHRPVPPCPRPTAIAVSAVGHDTALLSWTPNEVADSYVRIQFDTVDFTPGTPGHRLLLYGGDTCHLHGLTPNHPHWLYMRSDCGADSSEWYGVQFTTPCAPLSHDELPLSEDFDDRSAGDMTLWDGCWKIGTGSVQVVDMSVYEGRPNMALRSSNNGWFHLPPVDSVRTTVLRFNGHSPFGGSSNVTLQVGVMDDPFDIGSLQVLQTFTVNQNAWQEYTVPMAAYSGPGNTVAVKWTAYNMFFLDDITLEVYESCLPVEAVTVGEVGKHTALAEWTDYVPADSHRVVWYPAGQEWLADSVATAADSLWLTGLSAGTDYVVSVRSLCSDTSAGEAVTATFRTRCAVPLPQYVDFESVMALPDCWGATSMTTTTSTGSYTPAVPLLVGEGENHVVRFSSQYTDYYHYERGILLLPFVDTVVNRLRLTFDYRVERFPRLMSLMVGVIPGDDDIEHFIPVATIEPVDTLWHTYTVETGAVPIAEGRLVLMQHSTGSHDYVPGYWRDLGYVDNVLIAVLPACDRPATVWASHITSTTAQLHWLENNGLGTYVVNYNGADHTVTGDSVLLLTGLVPGNSYTVGVSRLCDGTYTDYRTTTFITACQPIGQLPWHEDFEMWPLGEIDYCWLRYYDSHEGSEVKAVNNPYTTTDMGMRMLEMEASNYTFDLQPYDALAVMPEMGVSLDGMAIGFRVAAPYSEPSHLVLEVGLMDDGGDSSSFRPVDTVPVAAGWSYYEHAFAPADSGRLALRLKAVGGNGRLLIDDLGIFPATDCLRPSALTVDTVTQRTATLVVTDTAAVGTYRYYWRPYASHADTNDSVDATGDTVTLTGLIPGIHYVASVAAICSDSTLSNVVYTEFYTDCDTLLHADLPQVETFNSGMLSHCWTLLPTGTQAMLDPSHRHGTTGYSLSLDNSYYSAPEYAVLPVVDTLAGLDLTFWVYTYTSFYHPGITVGIMSDPTDTATFTPVYSCDVSTGWTEHQVNLGPYSTLGHHIALRPDRGDSTGFVTIYVDDVTLSQSLPCERPESVTVDSVGATTAVLTIADGGDNRHYRVTAESTYGSSTVFVDFDTTVSTYDVTLSGLTPATDYTVSVASVCYDSSITFATDAHFTTLCAPLPLPWSQDFESETVYQLPRCWQTAQGNGRVFSGTSAFAGTNAFIASLDTSATWMDITTSELAFGNDSVRISFFAKASQGYTDSSWHHHALDSRLQLYSMLGDSLILRYDDTLGADWQLFNIYTDSIPHGSRLCLRLWRTAGSNSANLQLDNLFVSHISLPTVPHCGQVTDLMADSVGFTTATVSWTPQGDESRWEVHLRGEGTNLTTLVDSTGIAFTGLSHSTTYACIVRALCDDTLTGDWSDTLIFTTSDCVPVTHVTVTGITATSAVVSWQPPHGQTRWLLNYGRANFLQGEGTEVPVTGDPAYILEGLSPLTDYDVYIRAICDDGNLSLWSDRVTFTTASLEGISDLQPPTSDLHVYPNPATDAVKVEGLQEGATVTLYDVWGRQLGTWLQTGEGPLTISLDGLPAGAYTLRSSAHRARVMKK